MSECVNFHPAFNQFFEISNKANKHASKSAILQNALTKPPLVAFCNSKTFSNQLVRSKLKVNTIADVVKDNFEHGDKSNSQIWEILQKINWSPQADLTVKSWRLTYVSTKTVKMLSIYSQIKYVQAV